MNITYKEGKCFLGKTIIVSNGIIELETTVEVGPRIISFKKVDGENIMFNDINDNINKDISEIYGNGNVWHIYGGHRIWFSPEELKTYVPDNAPVKFEKTPSGIKFYPNAIPVQNLSYTMELKFTDTNTVDVITYVTNTDVCERELSIWALTVCKTGGELSIDLSSENTGFLANRNLVFWSYSDIKDSRFTLENDKIILKSSDKIAQPFKVGIFKKNLKTVYNVVGSVFIKEVESPELKHPDNDCNMETYTNNFIHEVETLSPLYKMKSKETKGHTEKWTLL